MTCPRCKRDRSTEHHGRDRSRPGGVAVYCRECSSEIRIAYYAANREKIREQKRVEREKRREREERDASKP